MNRRATIRNLGFVTSAAVLTPAIFSNCSSDNYSLQFLNKREFEFIDSLAEFILPETERSPGARLAKVANFIDQYIAVCYSEDQKKDFLEGIVNFEKRCKDQFKRVFKNITADQKGELLRDPDIHETAAYQKMKSLILFGFFTSQQGMNQALRYVAVPGGYEGDISYTEGEGAWAL